MQDKIWTEKWRPKTLEESCFPQRIKEKFKNGIYGNLLLTGSQGTGKTTLAYILSKSSSTKIINASLETGIDVIRTTVMDFCSMNSFTAGKKTMWIEESDFLSTNAQAGLRGAIEKFHSTANFIFTCNYPEKILDPIKSRLEQVSFDFDEAETKEQELNYIKRIFQICQAEGLKIDKEAILGLLKKYSFDMRSIINSLQGFSRITKHITKEIVDAEVVNSENTEFYQKILTSIVPSETYAYVKSNFLNKERQAYEALSSNFLEYLMLPEIKKIDKVGQAAVIIQKYQYESIGVIDKLVCLLACVWELNRILR